MSKQSKIINKLEAIDTNLRAAIEAAKEMEKIEVEVLLDPVSFDSKPQTTSIVSIVSRLPQNKININLEDLANAVTNGQSWKASVLYGKDDASFVSSSLVALDIDNKESYTSIDEFLAMDHKYKPCFVYETFSSTKEHEKFRVVYAFKDTVYDFNTMVALYEEVKSQYPGVDIDPSVGPGKVLFGGKSLRYFNNVANGLPEPTDDVLKPTKVFTLGQAQNAATGAAEAEIITEEKVLNNLSMVAEKYADVEEIDINDSYEWINENINITDALGIPENVRFRCVLPKHEDNNPSARITTIGNEQVYFCSCEANGYRLITLLSKLLDKSEVKIKTLILNALNVSYGSVYQKATERYIADVRRNLTKIMTQDLKDHLQRRRLFQTYKLLIDFADAHIPYNSLVDDDRVAFFISKRYLQEEMKQNYIAGNAGQKLLALCELGLLRKCTDSELKDSVLSTAARNKEMLRQRITKDTGIKVSELYRIDFYELVDLSPSVVKNAMNIANTMKTNAVRQKGNGVNRRVNILGAEEVTNNINVQSNVNTNKLNAIKTKLETIIAKLLASNIYFSEADLMKAYKATDTKHITREKAQQTVLDFIPLFLAAKFIQRVRINKTTRKQYEISNKYPSNSFVYIADK